MKKAEFTKLAAERILILDGATGSNLVKAGMSAGVCPEAWILDHPDVLISLQKAYADAGSDIVYAPTFTGNRIKLKEYGLTERIREINKELVMLSKKAVEGRALVAGDLTMTGLQLKPMGPLDFEELIGVYKEQIGILAEAGADLLVVETMMSLQETRAALIAAKETCDLPVMCTLTFENDGRTLFGSDAETCAIVLESLGAAAVGANCSTGPDKMAEVIKSMTSAVKIPVIAKPNAGMPSLDRDGNTVYTMDADTFAKESEALFDAGATILGGCCGTAPDYIAKLKEASKARSVPLRKVASGIRYLTSERKTLRFGLDDPFLVVGERINPTGKKALQAELREGSLEMVTRFTGEQEEAGASILDINVGMGGIDEKEMMLKVLEEVTMLTSLPLSIDTSPASVLEAALRRYPGRALVNSVSAESAVMEEKLSIAKKYGAMIILLPLSDAGLPGSAEEKLDNLKFLRNKAHEHGFSDEDLVVDGLVSTVGATPEAALSVLSAIRYAKSEGLATTCGLSNISFGLPERSFVNTAFLTMAIEAGLTMAILNPSQELLMNAAFASDLLMNKQGADVRYIDRISQSTLSVVSKKQEASASGAKGGPEKASGAKDTNTSSGQSPDKEGDVLYEDVLKGNRRAIEDHTRAVLRDQKSAEEILNGSLMKAIDEVGRLFNSGKYFLPQLISSAEAMKLSIAVLEPHMKVSETEGEKPVIVMATVKGDIHDIGKNLVCLMLKNHGFEVIDLGKDVDREVIIETAISRNAAIIGLSALMTTTMAEMKSVVKLAKERGVKSLIMVGGAVITPEYADEIGADAYSSDAADAVVTAKRLLGLS